MNQAIVTAILQDVATYRTLTRSRIQALRLPNYDSRTVRKILLQLVHQGLLNKTRMQVLDPDVGTAAPIYYSSRKGVDYLVAVTKDERWYATCTLCPNWQHSLHALQVADAHILFDQAIARQADVQIERWINEWDVINPDEQEPHKHYRLHTLIRANPRLVCAPDAGFVLTYRGHQRTYYLELDRSTSGIRQIAASKTPGFAALAEQRLHEQHFPGTGATPFRVLCIALTPGRRDALRKAIAPKPGAGLWRFVAWQDLKPATLLHEPLLYRCPTPDDIDSAEQCYPLVKRLENAGPR